MTVVPARQLCSQQCELNVCSTEHLCLSSSSIQGCDQCHVLQKQELMPAMSTHMCLRMTACSMRICNKVSDTVWSHIFLMRLILAVANSVKIWRPRSSSSRTRAAASRPRPRPSGRYFSRAVDLTVVGTHSMLTAPGHTHLAVPNMRSQ